MIRGRKGFTLIELIIVIIIIGILASIAVLMMQEMTKKAIASEAISALGTIKLAETAYYVEHNRYTSNIAELNLDLSGLTGAYFSQGCYSINPAFSGDSTFTAQCTPFNGSNNASGHWIVDNWLHKDSGYIYMDSSGTIWSDIEGLGYPVRPYAG